MLGSFDEFLFDWVWNVFVHGFCVSILRPLILIGLGLVLFQRLGAGLGLPHLFWRPRRWAQFCVGFVIGLVVWQVVLSGYLFEEFATNYTRDRPPFCEVRLPDHRAPAGVETPRGEMLKGEDAFHWSDGDTRKGLPAQNDFRFRYAPSSAGSILRYALVVACGAAFCVAVLIGSVLAVQWAARGVRKRKGWTASGPARPPSPLPYSVWLPLGAVFGFAALAALTAWACTFPVCDVCDGDRPSQWLLRESAGWGRQAGRQNAVKKHVEIERARRPAGERSPGATEGGGALRGGHGHHRHATATAAAPDPEYREALDAARDAGECETREWLGPYVPVYDAFFINALVITVLLVAVMVLGPDSRLVSPAVGILCLLNWAVAGHTFLNYFSPFPIDFVLLLLLGLVVVSGRAYKFSFPNMPDTPDPSATAPSGNPLNLSARYERLIAVENRLAAQTLAAREGADNALALEAYKAADQAVAEGGATKTCAVATVRPVFSREVVYPAMELRFGPDVKPPLALVCVSGGGSRAAAWTMRVLLEMERAFLAPGTYPWEPKDRTGTERPQWWGLLDPLRSAEPVAFPYHVRLLTGASGGMIAGSFYAASLAPPTGPERVNRNVSPLTGGELTDHDLFKGVCADFLTPIVHTLVTHDLPTLLLPRQTDWDRGRRLEETWRAALHGQLGKPFSDLRDGEEKGWRPSLVFAPMLIEDGRQLFISNLDLRSVARNRANLLGDGGHLNPLDVNDPAPRRLLSREGVEFFKLFPHATEFQVGTAARMSASFPYVLPAVPLPTNPPRRVVDAGYYDNYGVSVAASWLFTHMDWVRENTSGVVLIQIRDGAGGADRRRETRTDAFPSLAGRGLQWLTSPPEGLWNFRTAAHAFRDDNLLHLLNEFFLAQRHPTNGTPAFDHDFFATIGFEFQEGDIVALNFTLTDWERERIAAAVASAGFKGQLVALLDWWHRRLARARSARRTPDASGGASA